MKKIISLLLAVSMAFSMVACGAKKEPVKMNAGTYTATANGFHGEITLDVTVGEDSIVSVEVVSEDETAGVGKPALSILAAQAVELQTYEVDTYAGATYTSDAVREALKDALTQAGADLAMFAHKDVVNTEKAEDMSTQIVVAGGGMAGLLAGLTAADEGKDVIIVEKMPRLGGSVLVASAAFLTVESDYTKDVDDSIERPLATYHALNDNAKHQPDYEFLTKILAQTGEAVDYMTGDLAMEATVNDAGFAKTMFVGRGAGFCEMITKAVEARENITVLYNTAAEHIVMTDGKATGLEVAGPNGTYTISADKVIISTGGASWNEEIMHKYIKELDTVDLYEKANIGNTGDGFVMLREVGASMVEDLFVKASAPEFAEDFHFTILTKPGYAKQLLVDSEGKRFVNEAPANQMMLTPDMISHCSSAYYALYDTVNTDEALLASMKELAEKNDVKVVVYGATVEELAEKLGMDAETLKATIEKYNAACDAGIDEEFGKAKDNLVKLEGEGGYYAAYAMPASYGTIGGCDTDEYSHVLNTDGEVIENLFAAGECSTYKLFGDYYVGSASLGLYATTGRIAAKTAVSEMN